MGKQVQLELIPTVCPQCQTTMELLIEETRKYYKCPGCGEEKEMVEEKPEEKPQPRIQCNICKRVRGTREAKNLDYYRADDEYVCDECMDVYISQRYDAIDLAELLGYERVEENEE